MSDKIVSTVPFNFDELYTGLEAKFQEAGYDTNEGSNTSQLITAMAYFTSMLNANTAININETILPLATRRNNALQDARALGYEIQHKQSYTYLLTLTLSAGNHTIPKYTEFTEGDNKYYFFGKQIELTNVTEGQTIQISIIEGTLHKYVNHPDSLVITTTNVTNDSGETTPQYFIDIPFIDVEENGIEVYATYYDEYGNLVLREEWQKSDNFMIDADTELKKKFVRLDNIEYKTPRVYFTLAGAGEGLRAGSVVEINVLTTSGVDGELNVDDISNISHSLPSITITSASLISEGTDEETIQSIKENAPKFYNSANRAVTKSDYEAICNRQTTVNTSLVWGGDDEFPKSPGHIWFSFLQANIHRTFYSDESNVNYTLNDNIFTDWDYELDSELDEVAYDAQLNIANSYYSNHFIEDSEIRSNERNDDGQLIQPGVWDVLDNFKIPTLEFHNRHPIFLDFEYNIDILKYNITDSKPETHQTIFDIVNNYFTGINDSTTMEQFEGEYFHSSLEKRIDTILTDITGYNNTVSTKLLLTKKNVSQENFLKEYRDVYIPLSIPFEGYFDSNGYLIYDNLPSIDTEGFVDYIDETGQNIYGDIYTDWSGIQSEIQNIEDVITAPIRVKQSEEVILTPDQISGIDEVEFQNIIIVPDDTTKLDEISPDPYIFDKTKILLNDVELNYNVAGGWIYDDSNTNQITLNNVVGNDFDTVIDTVDVNFYSAGAATSTDSTLIVSPNRVSADGITTSTITMQAKDANSNNLVTGGLTVLMTQDGSAIISAVTDNADGTYTASMTNTVAETVIVSASINGNTVIDIVDVIFVVGAATTTDSTLSASPTNTHIFLGDISTITLQAKDVSANNLVTGGLDVLMSQDGSGIISAVTDNSDGTYTATMTNTVAETVIISATIDGNNVTDGTVVTFYSAGTFSLTNSSISASPTSVSADGITTATITLQAKDGANNNLVTGGLTVLMDSTGSANLSVITDNLDGTYTASMTNTVVEIVTVSATIDGNPVTDIVDVNFYSAGAATSADSILNASPTSVNSDGVTTSTITLQAKDANSNNLVTGGLDVLMTQDGSAIISAVTDNADGTYTASMTNTVAEIVTVSASIDGNTVIDIVDVIFVVGAATTDDSTLSASLTNANADGSTTSTITLQAKDVSANNLVTGGLTVLMTQDGSGIITDVTDNNDGTYTSTMTNTVEEIVTVSATINGNSVTSSVDINFYIAGVATSTDSTLSASPNSVNADGSTTSTITLQAKDANSNNLVTGGLTIFMYQDGSGIISLTTNDNNDGTYTATMTNTLAETVTVSARMQQDADVLRAEVNNTAGMYHLFNSYKKYIIIQLYVNASGFTEESTSVPEYNTPKSYLTTTEGFYDFTIDNFYLTTEGYAIIDTESVDLLTGNIAKKVSPAVYTSSPINMLLFRKDRQLDLKYNSPNFSVTTNVIPRLKRVTFGQGV